MYNAEEEHTPWGTAGEDYVGRAWRSMTALGAQSSWFIVCIAAVLLVNENELASALVAGVYVSSCAWIAHMDSCKQRTFVLARGDPARTRDNLQLARPEIDRRYGRQRGQSAARCRDRRSTRFDFSARSASL